MRGLHVETSSFCVPKICGVIESRIIQVSFMPKYMLFCKQTLQKDHLPREKKEILYYNRAYIQCEPKNQIIVPYTVSFYIKTKYGTHFCS